MLAFIVKGYPRLSETFIAQEIHALQVRGFKAVIVSLRHPTDKLVHKINSKIKAEICYLPEYLRDEPARVLSALSAALFNPRFYPVMASFVVDFCREPTRNRIRRFGQALVLACELSKDVTWLHTHYLHTPSAMTRYAARLLGLSWSVSAHAKDIWTTPHWQIRQHLRAARWCVTCTDHNRRHLAKLHPKGVVRLIYHGLDLDALPVVTRRPGRVLRLITVARAVEKKGLDTVLRALGQLREILPVHWRQIGSGPEIDALHDLAHRLGIADHVDFHGPMTRDQVFAALAEADIFCLPARVASDGDRDGLPNVLMEAMFTGLPVIASRLPAICELIEDGVTGCLIEPDDPEDLAARILQLARTPALGERIAAAGKQRIVAQFQMKHGIDQLHKMFEQSGVRCE